MGNSDHGSTDKYTALMKSQRYRAPATEREGNNLKKITDFSLKSDSSQCQIPAVSGFLVISSLDRGGRTEGQCARSETL